MTRLLLTLSLIAFFAWTTGRALDVEFARADGRTETALVAENVTYQGKGIRWWARRAVQARKDANARQQTIFRLRAAQERGAAHFFVWMRNAYCVYGYERGADGWETNTGNGYYGGMQADRSFQRAYAPTYYRAWGTADNWPVWAQLHMAYNGWLARGWQPWPNTARRCGLL